MERTSLGDAWAFSAPPKKRRGRWSGVALVTALLVLTAASVASAAVWTDQEDYTPGSVVTISGDNSNGAGYLAGETVVVEVSGPNGYAASCEAVADDAGAWSCQVTLWDDERAVGDYTYTATGQTSGVVETGVFSDTHQGVRNINFATSGLPAGVSITISGIRTNPAHITAPFALTFTSPLPSVTFGTQPGTTLSYSGFPSSVTASGQSCTLTSASPASPFTTAPTAGTTTVLAVYSCVAANTAPTMPGIPYLSAGSNPNNTGVFSLGWTASTDAEGDPITYLLQHKDADDAAFSNVASASSLGTNSYSFTAPGESEGTWQYRVRASDGSLTSSFSGESAAIVVDKSAPNAPTATADRDPDFAGGGGWYKDTVTISFADNGDPNLQDGSSGSGVDPSSIPSPVTFSSSNSHTASGTVMDFAGNESAPGSLTVQVDATDPVVNITCPSTPVILNSSAMAVWTASDAHSGLATAGSGLLLLDTSSVGPKTATSPTANDNVGHSASDTCSYSVVYKFSGFFEPVNNGLTNSAKAGQAIPIKWRLTDANGIGISDPTSFVNVTSTNDYCSGTGIDPVEMYAGSSGLQYLGDGYWQFNWKTPKNYAGQCRVMSLNLADLVTGRTANFQFK